MSGYDAVVVGSGPNGLAAAITLAETGRKVLVLEGAATIGGGVRSGELTLPGFTHDLGSAVHPLGAGSPFFSSLPLGQHGLEWVHPDAPVAQPLDGDAAVQERDLEATVTGLGADGRAYRRTVGATAAAWPRLAGELLGPVLHFPRSPVTLARFGLQALLPAATYGRRIFSTERARALFAGHAAHSVLPLQRPLTTSFGLMLAALGHAVGWPFPRGGAQRLTDALAGFLRTLGGVVETGTQVGALDEIPPAPITMLDVTPKGLVAIAGDRLPSRYRRALERYRYGPGAFKLDYALDGPIPWADPQVGRAGTVHVGGTLEEVVAAEAAVARGEHPPQPFLLLAQPSAFDPTRAPAGKHAVWVYTHVPNGSTVDVSEQMEDQIERFAPGFRERVLARHVTTPADLEAANPNLVGGDVGAGSHGGFQLLARPTWSLDPYATPLPGVWLCSASTPPGGGVHGMCGHNAARSALRRA